MSEWTVVFTTPGNEEIPLPAGLTATPMRFDKVAVGGCNLADIEIHGPAYAQVPLLQWLGYRVMILNRHASPVWWGYLEECLLNRRSTQIGLSIKEMANRIRVAYTYDDDGVSVRGTTAWSEDTESIVRYGIKELQMSLSDVNQAQAEARRDTALVTLGKPIPILNIVETEMPFATLHCSGWYATTGRRYYSQVRGLLQHDVSGSEETPLGHGFTGMPFGFARAGKITDTNGRMNTCITDSKVAITGSASNNGNFKILRVDNRKAHSYTSTGISFDPVDDMMDSNEELGFLEVDDYFLNAGAHSNYNRYYRVKESGAAHITLDPSNIGGVGLGAGPAVTVTRGNSIEVDAVLTREFPSPTVTLVTHGQKIAQAFSLTANVDWTVDKVTVRVKSVGAPTDNFKLELCSDASGTPGTVLESATIVGSTIGGEMHDETFDLSNTKSITFGPVYWLVLSRTGSNSESNYYMVEVDEQGGYTGGLMYLYTGSAWVVRDWVANEPNSSLIFRIYGAWETSSQIQIIAEDTGQFFIDVDMKISSGIFSNQYREGDRTGLDELSDLLDSGTTNDRRLLVEVTPERVFRVYEAASTTAEVPYMLGEDGLIRDAGGTPLEHGKLPVGVWCELTEISPAIATLARISPFFIERAEIDCRSGKVRIEPQGIPDVWAVGEIGIG